MSGVKTYLVLASLILFGAIWWIESEPIDEYKPTGNIRDTQITSLRMFHLIEKYSKENGVPMRIALGVAYEESKYQGPFHWNYNPALESSAGAVGPMQIMPSSASYFNDGVRPSRNELKTDIDLNVKISMRMLGYLKNKYGRWDLALGAYNTGKPCVNGYALRIVNGWLYGNNTQKIIRVH